MKQARKAQLRTVAEVRAWFDTNGMTFAGWATERGYHPDVVADLLRGKTKGRRGNSHNAAVELGLKAGVINRRARDAASPKHQRGI